MAAPSVLLLQARRPEDPSKSEERQTFALRAGVAAEQVESHDLLQGPPTMAEARRFDCLMVGGSGDYYVSKRDLDHFDRSLEFLVEASESGPPMFASCFGFQCLVEARGGEVAHDPPSTEVGTYEVSLTDEGREDPLFGELPDVFWAQLGRKDRAVRMPEGIPNLAASERCPLQALRVPGRPVWASQFHPELDGHTNRSRYLHYLEGYSRHMTAKERDQALSRFRPSPDTHGLLERFIELVFD